MRIPYLIILALLFTTEIYGQQKEIAGKVVDSKTLQDIPFAHLYNVNLKTGTHTNESGSFNLMVRVGDSIRISAIGFKTKFYQIEYEDIDKKLQLTLSEEVLELAPVNIFVYSDVQAFKQAILDSEVEPEQKLKVFGLPKAGSDYGKLAILPRVKAPTAERLVATLGPTIASIPIAVVDKERVKVERKKTIAKKYNSNWIQEVTGLEETEIDEFIRFCRLEESFIFEASEYDLTTAVLNCYEEFKVEHH